MSELNRDKHIERHKKLHENFDELVADYIYHTEKLPSKTTVMELINWSFEQTIEPTVKHGINK